jgi:hypothetical protein
VIPVVTRRRTKLVPDDCVEAFEVRCVLFFDTEGLAMITYDVDRPDHKDGDLIPMHEVLGVLSYAMSMMIAEHEAAKEENGD